VVYGVNGINAMRSWSAGDATYATVSAAPIANDITILANRLITANTTEGGINYFWRVRWSAVNDGTTWPATGYADLLDVGDQIVGIKAIGRTAAIVYRQKSAWIMNATIGDDSSAFTFDLIPASIGIPGPVSAAAIVSAEGNHYYMGLDGRIYLSNGETITPISATLDPKLIGNLNYTAINQSHGAYLSDKRQVWMWYTSLSGSAPNSAIIYNLASTTFEPLQSFTQDNITASFEVIENDSLDWSNWVSATTDWDNVPWVSWDAIPDAQDLDIWIGTLAGNVMRWFKTLSDNGTAIFYSASMGMWSPGPASRYKVNYWELYLNPGTAPETLQLDFYGSLQPYSQAPSPYLYTLFSSAIILNDQTTFYVPVLPGPTNPANIPANFLTMVMSGYTATGSFQFGGGNLYLMTELKGSYGVQ
jgi:hypothetical protein